MRDEITEPKHWRTSSAANQSRSLRRRADTIPLPVAAVDAVFDADQPLATSSPERLAVTQPDEPRTYPELVARIHEQLAVLEAQRRELQQLLDQAESSRT